MLFTLLLSKIIKCASNYTEEDFTDQEKLQEDFTKEETYYNKIREILNDNGPQRQSLITIYRDLFNKTSENALKKELGNELNMNFVNFNPIFMSNCAYNLFFILRPFKLHFNNYLKHMLPKLRMGLTFIDDFYMGKSNFSISNEIVFAELEDQHLFNFSLMKISFMKILFTAHKYHQFCLANFTDDNLQEHFDLIVGLDFFLNRFVLYFLDTIMLFTKNEQQMAMVKECFNFNWTATSFFTKINNEFNIDSEKFRLSCNIPFIYERNTRSSVFYNVAFSEWQNNFTKHPALIRKNSLQLFFTKYNFKTVDITIQNCMRYRGLVAAEFERRKQQKQLAIVRRFFGSQPVQQQQTVQEHQPVQQQTTRPSVIHGPGQRQLTMQEVSDFDRPGTSGQRQPDGEPPAKRAAVAVIEISDDSEEIDVVGTSSSSSSINVED
ncbi:hypothetical protein EHP00_1277 [Ecytonucleospora hepatopenaei]|uniref:Uncharacterized protein n=1 Tax=Ecytonucleospora hepatopenaei TaxID=646526 RepID=A0A1W0E6H5_9MICR|nr:hypothetical protein EHP00_1277 [Ecytonucleospora hepatopenaei]